MRRLNSILRSFNRTITKLDKLATKNTARSAEELAIAEASRTRAAALDAEAVAALGVANKLRALIGQDAA